MRKARCSCYACAPFVGIAALTANGCRYLALRAPSLVCRLTASKLALAVRLCFGARTPCCGHGPDRRHLRFSLLQPLFAHLLQVVLFECGASAEENTVSCSLLLSIVFKGGELKAAQVIGELEETKRFRIDQPKDDGLVSQRLHESPADGVGDNALPVIVVDLNLAKGLKVGQVNLQVPRQFLGEFLLEASRRFEVTLFVGESAVFEREIFCKSSKFGKQRFADIQAFDRIRAMAVHERRKMKREIGEVAVCEMGSVGLVARFNGIALIMHYEGHKIVARYAPRVPRFIYEYRKVSHVHPPTVLRDGRGRQLREGCAERSSQICWMLGPAIKNAGGLPPALEGSSRKNHHVVFTTAVDVCASKNSHDAVV